jgi:hypothetical protein
VAANLGTLKRTKSVGSFNRSSHQTSQAGHNQSTEKQSVYLPDSLRDLVLANNQIKSIMTLKFRNMNKPQRIQSIHSPRGTVVASGPHLNMLDLSSNEISNLQWGVNNHLQKSGLTVNHICIDSNPIS